MNTKLNELVLELYLHPDVYPAGIDPFQTDFSAFEPDEPVFSSYCIKAMDLVDAGKVSAEDVRAAFKHTANLDGPNQEYAIDLIRRVSRKIHDLDLEEEITYTHMGMLVNQANANLGRGPENEQGIRRGRRIAKRALKILDDALVPIDPNLKAEVHLAYGGSFARPVLTNLATAFHHYKIALKLKREADNDKDVARLEALIGQMIEHTIKGSIGAQMMGGTGMSLLDMQAAYEAAKVVGRRKLIVDIGLNLAETYRGVGQPDLAEPVFKRILAKYELDPALRIKVEVGLAAAISEQHHFTEALTILEPLFAEGMNDQLGLVCLGNCRRETGDLSGAREVFESILQNLPPLEDNQVPLRESQLKILIGQLDCWEGNQEQGLRLIREGLELVKGAVPILDEDLNRAQIAAKCFLDAGHYQEARECINHAQHIRNWHLQERATPQVLDSILSGFRELDFYDVELALTEGGEGPVFALTSAEAAKGRLLTWSQHQFDPEMLKAIRIFERQDRQLARVLEWLKKESSECRVVSLFATTRGLAVFSFDQRGDVQGRWVTPFSYPTAAKDMFEPWEELVGKAFDSRLGLWETANLATDYVLQWTGELLWRAFPDLLDGGERLIIIPHRMFRSIPLAAALLPGGVRLGDLFQQISVFPSLAIFSDACERQAQTPTREIMRALVDPDHSLPFARLEALTLGDNFKTIMGDDVTRNALREAFFQGESNTIHLSCHGNFNESNAWLSWFDASDGEIQLSDLLLESSTRADLVVLGACEAGKSQRSPSDEPIGFTELLIQAGVGAVVSPVWKVDDFTTLLFVIKFYQRREDGIAVSVASTARWLRELTANDARIWVRKLRSDLDSSLAELPEQEDVDIINNRLDEALQWLDELPPRERPFSRPLDWAGFQMTGLFSNTDKHTI